MTPDEERQALRELLASKGWALLNARAAEVANAALGELETASDVTPMLRAQGRRKAVSLLLSWPDQRIKAINNEEAKQKQE